jgi:2-polyprenyl-3-methyl-5-hydroxy-6-metoxy-1,4-benzoquinol methylase
MWNLQDDYGTAVALRAAYDTTLLRSLLAGPATAEEHATRAGTDARATRLVLNLLVTAEIAQKQDERFAAAPLFAMMMQLLPGGPDFTFGLWGHTTEFLKTGEPWLSLGSVQEREQQYRTVVGALATMFEGTARWLAEKLVATAPVREVLDIGCGSGVWGLSVGELVPGARVTGLDLPAVLDVFAERAAARGIAERTSRLPGDMHAVEIPAERFDLVIIANVLRLETPDRAASLVKRAAAAVQPGGRLIIVDALAGGTPERERQRAVYALHLAMRMRGGQVYDPQTIEGWMKDAGLQLAPRIPVEGNVGALGVVQAEKPAVSEAR